MSDRLPPLPPEQWTPEQRAEAEAVIRGPRGALVSPFIPLLRSPELMGHAQRMGEFLRYRSSLGMRLSEFAILLTARAWSQQVEWALHGPIAERAGVPRESILAIAEGRRPATMSEDEAAVFDFCTELHRDQRVSDPTWDQAVQRFGETGAVDLIGITGYYTFLSMVMNASRTAVPASPIQPLEPLPANWQALRPVAAPPDPPVFSGGSS